MLAEQQHSAGRPSMNADEFRNILRTEEGFWWFRGMRGILWPWLDPVAHNLKDPAVVAEAGCGTGGFAVHFQERYGQPVLAMDLEDEGLQSARSLGLQRLVRGDILRLPFLSESVDLLLSLDVVVHLQRGLESQAFQECMRVLRPGGRLVIRVSALDALHSRHSVFTWERQRFTKGRLVRSLEAAGLKVERVSYCNSLLLPVAWFKFRIWEPLTGAQPASGLQPMPGWLNWLLLQPLRFEAWCFRRGFAWFPLGQSLLCVAVRPAAKPLA
jgi:SAM-dependent methyltransferase